MTNLAAKAEICDSECAETMARQQAETEQGPSLEQSLHQNFSEALGLPAEASLFLLDIWAAIQLFDDVADGDEIARADLDRVIWSLLVGLHGNPFFEAKRHALLPVLATMVLKWQASDMVERAGQADARSYVWRAGYYDLILIVVQLCHGVDVATKLAPIVMQMYGETLADYLKEFPNA